MVIYERDIAVDMGTSNTLVFSQGKGLVLREPTVVAVDKVKDKMLKIGEEAKKTLGRTPANVIAIHPIRAGVISDYDMSALMLRELVSRITSFSLFKPRILMCVPSSITGVEERAVIDAAIEAGARRVYLVETAVATAIGAGVDIKKPDGHMVVDIGGGTAEVAVISLSGIVASRSVRCAGDALDQSITSFIKRKYNLLVGERTAEQIKLEIGSACPPDPTDTEHGETTMEIKGRNLVDGLPKDILIRSEEVREAMNENLMRIVEAIKDTLECTPPELSSDIIDRGIMLSGGGALLRGLDTLIQNETGIEVHIAEAPLDCVALGAGAVLDHPDLAGTRREELSYL